MAKLEHPRSDFITSLCSFQCQKLLVNIFKRDSALGDDEWSIEHTPWQLVMAYGGINGRDEVNEELTHLLRVGGLRRTMFERTRYIR